MDNTYIVVKNGIVVNRILAKTIEIARKVSYTTDTIIEDNNNSYSVGDNYTE